MNNSKSTSRNILLSGAGGFLGFKLAQVLTQRGYNVTGIIRNKESCLPYPKIENLSWLVRDIAHSPLTDEEANAYDTIIHLAGATEGRGDDRRMHFLANEMTTIGLISHQSKSINKFIYASSQVVYGNPNSKKVDESFPTYPTYSSYAASKINSENWLRLYQSQASNMTISLRLCGFMDGGGLVDTLISECLAGNDVELFGLGQISRDYIHTDYFNDLILGLLRLPPAEEYVTLNVGSGQDMTSHKVALLICELTNSTSQLILSPLAPRRNDFVYKLDKLISMLDIPIPTLNDQILEYTRLRIAQSVLHP